MQQYTTVTAIFMLAFSQLISCCLGQLFGSMDGGISSDIYRDCKGQGVNTGVPFAGGMGVNYGSLAGSMGSAMAGTVGEGYGGLGGGMPEINTMGLDGGYGGLVGGFGICNAIMAGGYGYERYPTGCQIGHGGYGNGMKYQIMGSTATPIPSSIAAQRAQPVSNSNENNNMNINVNNNMVKNRGVMRKLI